jgi:hypothetical protein
MEDPQVTDFARVVTSADLKDGKLLIRKGKKVYHQVVVN